MEEKPNYYAVIPATVRYDNTLRANEKLLYGEITALSQSTGECWANNKYFSELYNVKINAIATWIKHLKDKNYIDITYLYNGKEIKKRIIKIGDIQKDTTYYSKRYEGGIQKGEDNNTSINNINKKKNIKKKRYGQFSNVLLTDEEYAKLEKSNLLTYIDSLDSYIESKGKKYKSHYATILNWSRKDQTETIPEWFDKEIKIGELTESEKEELDSLLRDFGD